MLLVRKVIRKWNKSRCRGEKRRAEEQLASSDFEEEKVWN